MSSGRRLRVLLLASGIDATDVGETWSSYQWVSRLSEWHDITVLTYHQRGRPAAAPQLPRARVIEWPDWPLVGRFPRFNQMLKPGYAGFYLKARRWLRRALARGERFDLVHQLSPLAPRYPCAASGFGIPLIVGPLGGSLPTPASFASEFGSAPWYSRLRALDDWRLTHDPWLRRTLEGADAVIGVAPYVADLFGGLSLRRFEIMSETGIVKLPELVRGEREHCRNLLFVGRVIRSKGARDAIRALARLKDLEGLRLEIVGEGDDRPSCEREVREHGLESRVRFHGRVPRAEVDGFYTRADAFVFPSFREASGNVVMEALGWGLPVITAAVGGPGFVVDDRCGIRLPVRNPEQYSADLAAAIRGLVEDPSAFRELAAGAQRRASDVALWDRKIERLLELYQGVTEDRADSVGGSTVRADATLAARRTS